MDKPELVEIIEVRDETPRHKTYTLDVTVNAVPGQFCMLWIPGLDEKPMSFSGLRSEVKVTVKKVGEFTGELFKMTEGDEIGFRGPYGSGFTPAGGNVCVVGGGCGIAPLAPLADKVDGTAIIAAKSRDELMFTGEFREEGFNVIISTDDGSAGVKGMAHQVLGGLLESERFSCVYTCGPEIMMKKVLDLCIQHGVECQLSLERYVKCGIGVCGSCTIAGMRVCVEGPVFEGSQLAGTEFGVYTRDACGCRRGLE
jgi:dihydroorotate dehydrogenase electron transfer subunit